MKLVTPASLRSSPCRAGRPPPQDILGQKKSAPGGDRNRGGDAERRGRGVALTPSAPPPPTPTRAEGPEQPADLPLPLRGPPGCRRPPAGGLGPLGGPIPRRGVRGGRRAGRGARKERKERPETRPVPPSPPSTAVVLPEGGPVGCDRCLAPRGVIPEGGQGGRVRPAPGEGGRNARRQGRLGRITGPGTGLSPRSPPSRAPLAPLVHPPESPQTDHTSGQGGTHTPPPHVVTA